MPRPRPPGPGDGRAFQPISAAVRFTTSIARGSESPCSRNSTGSRRAAAANSSVKLSTAKQLAIFPGARMFDERSGTVLIQCTTTS